MIYIFIQNIQFFNQIKYVFDYFLSFIKTCYNISTYENSKLISENNKIKLAISYGNLKPDLKFKNHIHIYESDLFGKKYLKPDSLPDVSLKKFEDIYIIYRGCKKIHNHLNKTFSDNQNLIETDIDIVASSFFMLTRYEEYIIESKGKFGNFKGKDSIAFKNDFLNMPIVNEYIDLLWEWIKSFRLGIKKRNFWGDKDYAFALTHDIDYLKIYPLIPPIKSIIKNTIRGDCKRVLLIINEYLKSLIGRDAGKVENLISISNSYNFKSTFFIKSGGESKYDDKYYKNNSILKNIVNKIILSGNEVALHGSFNSYVSSNVINSEKKHLEAILDDRVYGIRQHCLNFLLPKTWIVQEKNNLIYDSSMIYSDNIGFRCGICHPFKPFDLYKNKIINIWEIPLTVMDSNLIYYKKNNIEDEKHNILNLIEKVKKYNGIFNLLCHNTTMSAGKNPEWNCIYLEVLDFLKNQNCYNDKLKDLLKKWELSMEQ